MMQNQPSVRAQMALKSRAEVQLVHTLNEKKPKSASGYLDVEQQRIEDEAVQQQTRLTPQNLKQFRIGGDKNALSPTEDQEMIAVVRQLEYHVVPSTPEAEEINDHASSNQIELNAIQRRERHMEAQRVYADEVKQISEDIEVAIIRAADQIKETLANKDDALAKCASDLIDDALLLKCEYSDVMDLWAAMEGICGERTTAVEAFGAQLEAIEATRIKRVGQDLKLLTQILMDTAHALPPEVERIIEAEAYEVNVVVISNRRTYADLMARIATQDVDVLVQSRLRWEAGLARWRKLRHDDAICKFHDTINSTWFTDPPERMDVVSIMREELEATHRQKRLAALETLHNTGADLTSQQVQQVLNELSDLQRYEEDTTALYFDQLRGLHDDKGREAQVVREHLRLELHGFGALATEGDVVTSKKRLASMLADESLEGFFRMAGGLRCELDSICQRLVIAELIYQANLTPLLSSVRVLLSALPLEQVMESQGKGAERKAIQTTLDKIRKAAKSEIVGLLPTLQNQVAMLLNLSDMSELFKAEVEDVGVQLRLIVQEYESLNAAAARGGSTASGDSPSQMTTGKSSPACATSAASGSPGKPSTASSTFLGMTLGGSVSTTSLPSVDLQAVRKVQRRLGTLVFASELSGTIKDHLAFIAEQLELQMHANQALDTVITAECQASLAARQEESKQYLADIGQRIDAQSGMLHDQCERLAKFYLRVTQTMEQSEDSVRFVNLSVLDLLDSLKDTDEERNAELETQYANCCARVRHAADGTVLQIEFDTATTLLHEVEASYRLYQKLVALAAQNHHVATHKQRETFLHNLCSLFGLVSPSPLDSDFDVEHFLSVKFIDDATLPKTDGEAATGEHAEQSTGESSEQSHHQAPQEQPPKDEPSKQTVKMTKSKEAPHESVPQKERFNSTTGLELDIELKTQDLIQRILTEKATDDKDQPETSTNPLVDAATAMDGNIESAQEETPEQVAERVDREQRLARVEGQITRDFTVLVVESSMIERLLSTSRDVLLSKFDTQYTTHIMTATDLRAQRLSECNLLLEERLRMHWPRKGRLDVQIYQPRIGELYSHRQRYDRHIRSMAKKVETQQMLFQKQVGEVQARIDDVRLKQLTLQTQLPLQQSLAALQGLEVKSKKLLASFRADTDDKLQKLAAMTTSDHAMLTALTQDYVRVCTSQVFSDLLSGEVISGCDYHPEEVGIVEAKLQSVETQIREGLDSREPTVKDLVTAQQSVLESAKEFKTRYQSCLQSLSMKEGLGQKYGLPRRTAQERYRSETTRADQLSSNIDDLLKTLESIIEIKQVVKASTLHEVDIATQILHLLVQLRAQLVYRGMYFGLLKNASQLEPTPVDYDAGGVSNRAVFNDKDIVEEEYATPPATPFLEFVKQVAAKCRDDTKQLYQQEGKTDELPASGVPIALEEYLKTQAEKAHEYVLQQELLYREQVDHFGELLALAPDVVLGDFMERTRTTVRITTLAAHEELQLRFAKWMEEKNRNTIDLRPDLCSPNNAQQLQTLCDREAQRSETTLDGVRACRASLMEMLINCSADFEKELLAMWKALTVILDTSVMTIDDLNPFSGEELPKPKRKSLKRLRKVARIQEFGDPREVKQSDDEMKKLSQLGEAPRYPRRAWHGVPSFGMHLHWEAKKNKLLDDDDKMNAAPDSTLAGLTVSKAVDTDGAVTALLTHAHRCLFTARDEVYAAFVEFVTTHGAKLLADLQERLRDEVKWTESWRVGIENVRRQARSAGM